MSDLDAHERETIAERLRQQALQNAIRISLHAHQEMVDEEVSYGELREVLLAGRVLENYPEHKRGACCLVCGWTGERRCIHAVGATSRETCIVITVYEPKPPKWPTPFERGKNK
ncbi:MAG: DUF4258 domain-containing protein [Candidatus Sumerlaeota bacterium]|nr:DUF4258 domain-containing protein [Candidatus Sumerlaeota bacterium]